MGLYDPLLQQQHSLLRLLRFLDSPSLTPSLSLSSHHAAEIAVVLEGGGEVGLEGVGGLEGEGEVVRAAGKLASKRDRERREEAEFEVYELLGYHKEFSELAHQVIEKNNQAARPLNNAPLLKQLAAFYQKNGTGGTEYLLNACTLYCKRAEEKLELERVEEA